MVEEDIRRDRAELANQLVDIEFIAIAESSAGAIDDPDQRRRLLLLGGIKGDTEEAKTEVARQQAQLKMQPWESLVVLYRLIKVPPKQEGSIST